MDYSELQEPVNNCKLKAGDVAVFSKGNKNDLYIITQDNISDTCHLVSLSDFHVFQVWSSCEDMYTELLNSNMNGFQLTEIIPSRELKLSRI